MVIPQERNWPSWALPLPKLENFILLCTKWAGSSLPSFSEGTRYEGCFPEIRRIVMLRMCEGARVRARTNQGKMSRTERRAMNRRVRGAMDRTAGTRDMSKQVSKRIWKS